MGFAAGDRLGVYQILGKLGEGGMGEVYRARDTSLNRDVALKVLPAAVANDAGRVARFTREAQTLASLNHPNIGAIYGIESSALVMELVAGDDLSEIIRRGSIPLADALPIAKQIADALEAAHEQGIIHRDLKPGNIKVKADGVVKVLDFGLAKALGAEGGVGSDLINSPTLTVQATQMGMILGTAAYMAPEQARGKAVDRRADVWAFGAVLYEMLSGRRAFDGDDVSITLASVLKDEPKWTELPPDLPPSIMRLLRRCLEKDPRRRLSAIGDARLELDEREHAAALVAAPSIPSRQSLFSRLWPAAVGVVITAVAAALLWPSATTTGSALSRLSILPPPGEQVYPDSSGVAVSPDGTMVVFIVGSVARSENELWLRSIGSTTARRLEGTESAALPFWSPDSKRIGFFTNSKLRVISASGGRAETLSDAPSGRGAVWTRSNIILFAPDAGGPLFRISANGGTPDRVTTLDPARKEYGHRFPTLLPDGDHFLYVSLPGKNGKFDIFAGSLSDNTFRTMVTSLEAAPVFAEPGWLLYARQGVLAALPFDATALKVTGDPVVLGDEPSSILDPQFSWTAGWSVSVSASGSLGYYSAPSLNTVATWYDETGAPTGTLNLPPAHYESVTISPDGTRGVVVRSTSPSESSLWLVDVMRGGATALSSGRGRNDTPVWSPDGSRVVWASDRDGTQSLYVKNVNDAAPEQLLFASAVLFKNPVDWTRDGSIVMTQLDQDTSQNVWLLDASGTKPPTILVRGALRDNGGPVSPDGRWMLFSSEDSGRFEVYAQSFPMPARKVQISDSGATSAWWTRDGRAVVLLGSDLRTLSRVDLQPGETLGVGKPRQFARLPAENVFVDAMPDRRRFLAIAPERTGTGSVTVVQNWREALTGKALTAQSRSRELSVGETNRQDLAAGLDSHRVTSTRQHGRRGDPPPVLRQPRHLVHWDLEGGLNGIGAVLCDLPVVPVAKHDGVWRADVDPLVEHEDGSGVADDDEPRSILLRQISGPHGRPR